MASLYGWDDLSIDIDTMFVGFFVGRVGFFVVVVVVFFVVVFLVGFFSPLLCLVGCLSMVAWTYVLFELSYVRVFCILVSLLVRCN